MTQRNAFYKFGWFNHYIGQRVSMFYGLLKKSLLHGLNAVIPKSLSVEVFFTSQEIDYRTQRLELRLFVSFKSVNHESEFFSFNT